MNYDISSDSSATSPFSTTTKPAAKMQKSATSQGPHNATTKHTTAVSGTESIKDDIKSLRKLVVDIQKEQRAIKVPIHAKIDSVAEDMKKNIENEVKSIREYVDMSLASVNDKLGQLHQRIRGLETSQKAQEPYTTEVSIVAFNVPFTTEENILATVEHMPHNIQDGLGLRDIRVIRAERTPMRNGKPGIVKVELSSLDDKKFVLRAKTSLRNTIKYKKVYMRGAQTHAERLNELNFKAILHDIPGGNRYRITGSGRLVYKDQGEARDTAMTQEGEDAAEGGRDAGARQRGGRGGQIGRGRGGRGGHGLRDFRGQDRNAAHFNWDDEARDSNR